MPLNWRKVCPSVYQNRSPYNAIVNRLPRIYAPGAEIFPPSWNFSSSRQATKPYIVLYYHRSLNCSAFCVCLSTPCLTNTNVIQANSSGRPTSKATPPRSKPSPAPTKRSRRSRVRRHRSKNSWTMSACGRNRKRVTHHLPFFSIRRHAVIRPSNSRKMR